MYSVTFTEVVNIDKKDVTTDRIIYVPGVEPALSLANLLARISISDPSGRITYCQISVQPFIEKDYETQKK